MNKISTIIIGLGNVGLKYDLNKKKNIIESHYRSFLKNRRFKLKGLIDNNKLRLNFFKKIIKNTPLFNSFSEIKKKVKSIDLVVIATPTFSHCDTIIQTLRYYHPKIIFCEKPFCSNLNQVKKILRLCKKKKINLFVNYLRRTDPNILNLKKFLNNKKNTMKVFYSKDILINASHFIDLSTFYFGKMVDIFVEKKTSKKISSFKIKFQNGLVVFQKVGIKNKLCNTFSIENNEYKINQNKKYLFINSKNKKKKLRKKENLMFLNTKELCKEFRGKKSMLAIGKNALYVHEIINKINTDKSSINTIN